VNLQSLRTDPTHRILTVGGIVMTLSIESRSSALCGDEIAGLGGDEIAGLEILGQKGSNPHVDP
jgi:hypothetical protein